MDPEPTNPPEDAVEDFLSGLSDQLQADAGERWHPGLLYSGAAENAGMARHDGELISTEEYERRLHVHKEEHGPIGGIETIELNVVEAEAKPFEQEIREPE